MLIPPTSSAAQAASIVSQATAKESSSEAAGAVPARQSTVEKSSSTSADRDAQGQGDGLPGDRRQAIVDELEVAGSDAGQATAQEHLPAPTLPGETPCQLDISG